MTSQILGMRPSVLTGAILVASVLFASFRLPSAGSARRREALYERGQ
jgi:hypothetical protein